MRKVERENEDRKNGVIRREGKMRMGRTGI